MDLYYRKYGKGPTMIIVHGLYGSSDNWISIGKEFAKNFEVYIIDQRNHGNSPHSDEHNYELMKNDLLLFMDNHNIDKAILLGHSMGGKVNMHFALEHPERLEGLIVVDISPRSYKETGPSAPLTVNHQKIIEAMMKVDFSKADSRMDIDSQLSSHINSQRIRQFLLKNVKRKDKKSFCWKLNLEALHKAMPDIMDGVDLNKNDQEDGITGFPVLFIKGENSDYIRESDFQLIEKIFPAAEIVTIPNTGHWLHAEKPELFIKNIEYFLGTGT